LILAKQGIKKCKDCTKETGRVPGCRAVCDIGIAEEAANCQRREAEHNDPDKTAHWLFKEIYQARELRYRRAHGGRRPK
jgi:hypothetical protein